MGIKEFWKVWKKESLLQRAFNEILESLKKDQKMYTLACDYLINRKVLKESIYDQDQEINKFEIDIRKRVLEHLSINPQEDTTTSLKLIEMSRDIERIGDFSKNIFELGNLYGKKLEVGIITKKLLVIQKQVSNLFVITQTALQKKDKKKAEQVIKLYKSSISKQLDKLIEDVYKNKSTPKQKAIILVLFMRYLKRISAHLSSICSSMVNPYHKIRHEKRYSHVPLLAKKMKASK